MYFHMNNKIVHNFQHRHSSDPKARGAALSRTGSACGVGIERHQMLGNVVIEVIKHMSLG